MPWKDTSLKFYVEQAVSTVPQIQKVELVDSYAEDVGNMHIIKLVIEFRSPFTGLVPFSMALDENNTISSFDGCLQPVCQGDVNCTNIEVVINRHPGFGYYDEGKYFCLLYTSPSPRD